MISQNKESQKNQSIQSGDSQRKTEKLILVQIIKTLKTKKEAKPFYKQWKKSTNELFQIFNRFDKKERSIAMERLGFLIIRMQVYEKDAVLHKFFYYLYNQLKRLDQKGQIQQFKIPKNSQNSIIKTQQQRNKADPINYTEPNDAKRWLLQQDNFHPTWNSETQGWGSKLARYSENLKKLLGLGPKQQKIAFARVPEQEDSKLINQKTKDNFD